MSYAWTVEDCGALLDFCAAVGITDATIPLHVWARESNNDPSAHNLDGDASGIFQLMPDTARGLGYPLDTDPHLAAYRNLTVCQQLQWATKYYGWQKGLINSIGRFYVCTFLPALLAHGDTPGFILCAAQGPYAKAYRGNSGFDRDKKGWICVQDIVNAANAAYGPRAQGIAAQVRQVQQSRETQPALPDPDSGPDVA